MRLNEQRTLFESGIEKHCNYPSGNTFYQNLIFRSSKNIIEKVRNEARPSRLNSIILLTNDVPFNIYAFTERNNKSVFVFLQQNNLNFAAQIKIIYSPAVVKRHKSREMQNYELMVIFTPVLSEEEYKAAQKKFTSFLTENGGQAVHENAWGLKSLAYPIQKKTTGLYWVLEYEAPSDFNEKLNVQLLRDESVLRHMFTALDKYAVVYNARKRNGVASKPEKAEVANG